MIARNNNGQGHCSFPDRNGNVSVVLDFNGGTLESYRSDDFGVPTFYNGGGTMLTESGISNALLYTGREWNQTFGLYEYRARGYDSKLGSFLSEDPKGFDAGDYNLYRYVSNDPLDQTDPMGLDAHETADGNFTFTAREDLDLDKLRGKYITNFSNSRLSGECATGLQLIAGTVRNGVVHDMPRAKTWLQGEKVDAHTPKGTAVGVGWYEGKYPNKAGDSGFYKKEHPELLVNHVGVFQGMSPDGTANVQVYGQGGTLPLDARKYSKGDWSVIKAPTPYDRKPSDSAIDAMQEANADRLRRLRSF